MAEGETKRKPPAPPPAPKAGASTKSVDEGRRGPSEDAATAVYKPIPLDPDQAVSEPALPPRKRGSTISGIPGRKDDKPGPDQASTSGASSIPPPAPLLGAEPKKTWGVGVAPKPIEPAKTAGPWKVSPPQIPKVAGSDAKAPQVVKLEKTAGPWKVPPVPGAVPPPPKASAREPAPPASQPPPPPSASKPPGVGEKTKATEPERSEAPSKLVDGEGDGTTTTGLVAALTDEIVAAQEEEEAAAAAAEAAEDSDAEDSSLSGVQTLVSGLRSGQLDAASVRLLAAGWFVAGAALVALLWVLSGGDPEPAPPVAQPKSRVIPAPIPILVVNQAAAQPAPVAPDGAIEGETDGAGETGAEDGEEGDDGEDSQGLLEDGEAEAEDSAPDERDTSARKRTRPRSKKPEPKPEPAPAPAPKPTATPKPKPEPAKSAAQLLSEARAAYKRGDATKAHELAKASRAKSNTTAATELMVLSSCKRKQESTAARELKLLPLLKRASVKRDCKAMGVKL